MAPDGCRDRIDLVVGQDGNLAEGAGVVCDAEDCSVGDRIAVGICFDEVHVDDLVECRIWSGNFSSFRDLPFLQEVRQVRFLPVLDFEIMLDHGIS